MWKALVLVLVAVGALGAIRRGWGRVVRWRAMSRLDPGQIVRVEHNVTVRAMLYGMPPVLGLNPKRTTILRGDMAMTGDRFVLASSRGPLVDLGPDRGRRFTSARCTGPGRLVIEGDMPRGDGNTGLYRFELVVTDGPGWAQALAPFVREGDGFAKMPTDETVGS